MADRLPAEVLLPILRQQLSYDPESGRFTRQRPHSVRWADRDAGAIDSKGHRQIRIKGRLYLAHRLAWLMTYGRWPNSVIDHINRNGSDNRIANLRECTHSENSRNTKLYANNTSGASGVSQVRRNGKWMAWIQVNGLRLNLGHHQDKAQAIAARAEAERAYYGEFAPKREAA